MHLDIQMGKRGRWKKNALLQTTNQTRAKIRALAFLPITQSGVEGSSIHCQQVTPTTLKDQNSLENMDGPPSQFPAFQV